MFRQFVSARTHRAMTDKVTIVDAKLEGNDVRIMFHS